MFEPVEPTQSSLALILRARPYGESDKIVTFLSETFGKLTGIAKGAKNSRRRFANCLDVFTGVRVYFRSRPTATLVFMESCDLLEPPGTLVEPIKFAYASYLVELADQLTFECQPVPEIYTLLAEGLSELRHGAATSGFLRTFELRLLKGAGYDPQLTHCERCQRPVTETAHAYLEPTQGRMLCEHCPATRSGLMEFESTAVLQLDALRDRPLAEGRRESLHGSLGAQATQLLGQLLALHLPRPLRSTELIARLRRE